MTRPFGKMPALPEEEESELEKYELHEGEMDALEFRSSFLGSLPEASTATGRIRSCPPQPTQSTPLSSRAPSTEPESPQPVRFAASAPESAKPRPASADAEFASQKNGQRKAARSFSQEDANRLAARLEEILQQDQRPTPAKRAAENNLPELSLGPNLTEENQEPINAKVLKRRGSREDFVQKLMGEEEKQK